MHRDLTPHNNLLHPGPPAKAPVAKVGDLGLAKSFDQAGPSGLRTGSAMGKPYFMPRQQVINFKYSKPEVDVWALAACLYWMLTGAYPRDFPNGLSKAPPSRVSIRRQVSHPAVSSEFVEGTT